MRNRMQKKTYVMRAALIIFIAVLLAGAYGCAGRLRGQAGELVEVTEDKSGEVAEDKSEEGTAKETGEEQENSGAGASGLGSFGSEGVGDGDTIAAGTIYVHVCGEVVSPGVYELPAGSRLYEAVAAAGGLLDSAAGEQLNQAAVAGDGQQIYVPSREEAAMGLSVNPAGQDMTAGAADDGRISLNTASKEQLMTLSGIGEAKAASIISYREEHGGFQRIEELMEVEGIKEGVFNKVKDQIKI